VEIAGAIHAAPACGKDRISVPKDQDVGYRWVDLSSVSITSHTFTCAVMKSIRCRFGRREVKERHDTRARSPFPTWRGWLEAEAARGSEAALHSRARRRGWSQLSFSLPQVPTMRATSSSIISAQRSGATGA